MPGKESGPTSKGRSEARFGSVPSGSVPFDADAHDHQTPQVEHPLDPFWHTGADVKAVIDALCYGSHPDMTLEEALAKQAEEAKQPA